MDIELLAKIAGVLGLVLSIAVFLLTRWERRKRVIIELESGDASRFLQPGEEVIGEDEGTVVIRVANMGAVPIAVDRESFTIRGNGKSISRSDTDWLGVEKIPAPLAPLASFEVAVFKEAFEHLLGREELKPFMNTEQYEKTIVPVLAEFREHNGRKFVSKGYSYFFYVGEIGRRKNAT